MEIREVFSAEPYSVFGYLSDPGLGLYIPPFQRSYRWEPQKIARLIDDVVHGLAVTPEMPDSICFLGTVIALRDTDYRTVEPIHREDVQSKVMQIIDGQQRLTTLLLLTTVLHEKITALVPAIDRDSNAFNAWLVDAAVNLAANLQKLFIEDKNTGEGPYRYYPRMIRAYLDVWSRRDGMALYKSPIAHYVFSYYTWVSSPDRSGVFSLVPLTSSDTDEANAEAHAQFALKRANVKTYVTKLEKGETLEDTDGAVVPSPETLALSENLQSALFNYALSESVASVMLTQANDNAKINRLLRLVQFASYLLNRVSVTVVTAKREEYAFDMFEALNTTGEPLTAVETFKPRAIAAEGLAEWKNSPSRVTFDQVDAFLDRAGGDSSENRQKATNNLLVPFALAQSGKKLSKRLNEQRRYLKLTYETADAGAAEGAELTTLDEKRRYMSTMANVSRFLETAWTDTPEVPSTDDATLAQEARLSLRVLQDANHEVVVGALSRFFDAYVSSPPAEQGAMGTQFCEITRAAAGFFGLWRGAFGSTSGIDDIWRAVTSGDSTRGFSGVARRNQANASIASAVEVRAYLMQRLADAGVDTKQAWIQKNSKVGVYEASRPLTRLLLLAASDDSAPDLAEPGLVKRGRAGVLPMLTLEAWENPDLRTIEHVAPQVRSDGWDEVVYTRPGALHCLGNLTLLPGGENSSISNAPWDTKRVLYRALSARTVEEAQRYLRESEELGVELGGTAQAVVERSRYLPLLESVARVDSQWNIDLVEKRSECLSSLAYDRLIGWVRPSS